MACVDYMDPYVRCSQKTVKLNHSLHTEHELYKWIPSHGNYCQTSNMRRTLFDDKFVDHSDVVGASPVGAAPTTSSFST